jgi:GDP-L-fucose synthase
MREFLHVDDMARASVFVMEMDDALYAKKTRPDLSHINVGTGEDCTIRALAEALARVIGYEGRLEFDATKPDGTPRKLMDVSRLTAMGWRPEIGLEDGLRQTYRWFLENHATLRG